MAQNSQTTPSNHFYNQKALFIKLHAHTHLNKMAELKENISISLKWPDQSIFKHISLFISGVIVS